MSDGSQSDSERVEATSVDALVVGGGPAGLTVAAELARSGRDVVVVEATDRLGGMAASLTIGGVRVDLGSHRLHPVASDRVEALLRELLGADLQDRPRNGRLRLGGRWVRFPLRPLDLARALPPSFVLAALRDTVAGPWRRRAGDGGPDGGDDTFARVVRDGLGPAMLDWFYGPYAAKLWGRPADELAGELARRRIAASSPGKLLAKLARAIRSAPIVFRYPRLGYGQVVDGLVAACRERHVDLRTNVRVVSVDVAEPSPRVELDDGSVVRARRVFWAAPPTVLAGAVRGCPVPAPAVALRHRAMVLVYLVFDGPRVTTFDAHYLPAAESIASRVSEPANYRDGPDPDGRTVLCAEVPCDVDDEVWRSQASVLADRLVEEFAAMGLTDRVPVDAEVVRLPHVYPVITPDQSGPLADFLTWSHQLPGVTPIGRQGLFVADNLHHVLEMGLAGAECLRPDGSWDEMTWAAALERFAAHVVED